MAFASEHALLLRVALPLPSQRQRQAACPFAVEDQIAEPLEAVHVVLGPELAPGEYLVCVVRRSVMEDWAPQARGAGLRLVPDVLGLPVPPEGGWSVRELAGRVLVRRADGTGFATRATGLEAFWRVAQSPQIVLFGGRLPEALPIAATGIVPSAAGTAAVGCDLLQGAYARHDSASRRAIRRLAAVLALGLVAHGAVLAAETFALRRIAVASEAELRTALAASVPDLPASVPLDVALRRALPEAAPSGGGFLPLLASVSAVLEPQTGMVTLRNLAYDNASGSLSLLVEGPDLATLQRIETDLAAAGLGVSAGAATNADGGAEVRFVVQGSDA